MWGDYTKFMVGFDKNRLAYTFDVTREQDYLDAIAKVNGDGLSTEEYNRRKLEELKKVPGLLTPIPVCNPEWY